ncbi:MAG: 4-(cytidine 5'-diphospho)-2-C-methyl-D-erythritol kinase [Thermoanaerobaculia bacterium]
MDPVTRGSGLSLRAGAPAKVNRELRVGPPGPDGFHEIRSRFVTIDLEDAIEAREADVLELVCEPADLPADRSNLVVRAALALARRCGVEPRARLRLTKRIPVGAGLGGGSADAAATLRLLRRLWRLSASEEELSAAAATLGSDVPFFLVGGEAEVSGRGERVTAREDRPPVDLLLLIPPFSISTAEAYAAFDRVGAASAPPARLEIEDSGRFFGPNDLERAAVEVRPELAALLASARRFAQECAVAGSGSAIVLAGAGARARDELSRRHPEARVLACRTIGREEYRRRVGADDDSAPRA